MELDKKTLRHMGLDGDIPVHGLVKFELSPEDKLKWQELHEQLADLMEIYESNVILKKKLEKQKDQLVSETCQIHKIEYEPGLCVRDGFLMRFDPEIQERVVIAKLNLMLLTRWEEFIVQYDNLKDATLEMKQESKRIKALTQALWKEMAEEYGFVLTRRFYVEDSCNFIMEAQYA
jgi:hypothetical protein